MPPPATSSSSSSSPSSLLQCHCPCRPQPDDNEHECVANIDPVSIEEVLFTPILPTASNSSTTSASQYENQRRRRERGIRKFIFKNRATNSRIQVNTENARIESWQINNRQIVVGEGDEHDESLITTSTSSSSSRHYSHQHSHQQHQPQHHQQSSNVQVVNSHHVRWWPHVYGLDTLTLDYPYTAAISTALSLRRTFVLFYLNANNEFTVQGKHEVQTRRGRDVVRGRADIGNSGDSSMTSDEENSSILFDSHLKLPYLNLNCSLNDSTTSQRPSLRGHRLHVRASQPEIDIFAVNDSSTSSPSSLSSSSSASSSSTLEWKRYISHSPVDILHDDPMENSSVIFTARHHQTTSTESSAVLATLPISHCVDKHQQNELEEDEEIEDVEEGGDDDSFNSLNNSSIQANLTFGNRLLQVTLDIESVPNLSSTSIISTPSSSSSSSLISIDTPSTTTTNLKLHFYRGGIAFIPHNMGKFKMKFKLCGF